MEVKLFSNSVALTRATAKLFYELKKVHLAIARTENHARFLHRCHNAQVFPKFLHLRLPFSTPHDHRLRNNIARMLLAQLWKDQKAKLSILYRRESSLRCWVFSATDLEQFQLIWDYITVIRDRTSAAFKERQKRKFDALLQTSAHCHSNASHLLAPGAPDLSNTVVNISDRQLSNHELRLLSKGLSFVPTTTRADALTLATEAELTFHHCQSSIPKVVALLQDRCISSDRPRDNLSIHERRALHSLRNDSSVCILEADKGRKVVVMNKRDYDSKMDNIIYGGDYEKTIKDPSVQAEKVIRDVVKALKKRPDGDRRRAYSLLGQNSRHPSIYGVPKIHKPETPLRPIISTVGSVYESTAKFVSTVLTSYIPQHDIQLSVSNVSAMLANVKSVSLPHHNYLLISFDVVNLYGSLNVDKCRELILTMVNQDDNFESKFGLSIAHFEALVNVCLTSSYFLYKGDFFIQRKGLPMGSPCSPIIAELYMREIERRITAMPSFSHVNLWNRYVDDILTIWSGTHRQLTLFFNAINTLDPDIEFTKEAETNGSLPFLDTLLTRTTTGITSTVYAKPTASNLLINHKSYQHPRVKLNTIRGEIRRYTMLSDDPDSTYPRLRQVLANSGYPTAMVSREFARKPPPMPSGGHNVPNTATLVLPYLGADTSKLARISKKHGVKLVSRNRSSVGALLSKTYKYDTNKNTNVIYQLACQCGSLYIGETSQPLPRRVQQHKYATRVGDPNNGIAVHVSQSGHIIDWDSISILAREPIWRKRKIKEAIFIQSRRPALNLNAGHKLHNNWSSVFPKRL